MYPCRYYALTAVSALINYTENVLNIFYARESLRVEYQESEGFTIIDISTADNLELVASASQLNNSRYSSLFGILNHCLTRIGVRTLRSSILQPPCSIPDIESRLDCVKELITSPQMLTAIQGILLKLTNIEQILTLSNAIAKSNDNYFERQINYVLLLNSSLELVAPLYDVLENSRQPFFMELRNTLSSDTYVFIKDLLRVIIHNDAHPGKGTQAITQRCFAVKAGVNGLLDLLRKIYSEKLDEMREYVKKLGEKHGMQLTLQNNNRKSYHIIFHLNTYQRRTFKKSDLPREFIYVERFANSFNMKTEELINMSTRIDDILVEILKMSSKIIENTLLEVKKYLPLFYKLCADIAKLDMLQSLAQASSDTTYVRPVFRDYMEIKQSRHPMLEFLCSKQPVANDFASEDYNMSIITGPNGSGKSIYIRQILLLQVMAQVGCHVPAESATFRVSDRILARVYLEDYLEYGASAFVLELKEIQCFMRMMTKNTLLIIDELCRSTSVDEGTAMAMAIAEALSNSSAFVFFTTHYNFLTKLQDLTYNIRTLQLETIEENNTNGRKMKYNYNVIPGVCTLEKYGIYLAKLSWPETIIEYAENCFSILSNANKSATEVKKIEEKKRLKYDLESMFRFLKMKGCLSRRIINEKLYDYQETLANVGHYVRISPISESTRMLQCEEGSGLFENAIPLANNIRHFMEGVDDVQFGMQSNCNISIDASDYYVNPEVVYSPHSENDLTLELPQYLPEDSVGNSDVSFILPIENNFTNVLPEMLPRRTSPLDEYENMLEEDADSFSQFSKEFDTSAYEISDRNMTIPKSTNEISREFNQFRSDCHNREDVDSFPSIIERSDSEPNRKLSNKRSSSSNYSHPRSSSDSLSPNEITDNKQLYSNYSYHNKDKSDSSSFTTDQSDNEGKIKKTKRESFEEHVVKNKNSFHSFTIGNLSSEDMVHYTSKTSTPLSESHALNTSLRNNKTKQSKEDSTIHSDTLIWKRKNKSNISLLQESLREEVFNKSGDRASTSINDNVLKGRLNLSQPSICSISYSPDITLEDIQNVERKGNDSCLNKIKDINNECGTDGDDNEENIDKSDLDSSKIASDKLIQGSLNTETRFSSNNDLLNMNESNVASSNSNIIQKRGSESVNVANLKETPKKTDFDTIQKVSSDYSSSDSAKAVQEQNVSSIPETDVIESVKEVLNDSKISEIAANKSSSPTNIVRNKRKKALFKTPVKRDNSSTSSSSSNLFQSYPKSLTKRQIKEEYDKQAEKMLGSCKTSGDMLNYVQHLLNRPSPDQLMQCKTLAVIHKTNDGMVVLPVPEKKVRKRKFQPPPLKYTEDLDASIFSDKNSKQFEKFLQDDTQKIPIFDLCNPKFNVFTDSTNNDNYSPKPKFNLNIDQSLNNNKEDTFHDHPFLRNLSQEDGGIATFSLVERNDKKEQYNPSTSVSEQNKSIDAIMYKYLSPDYNN